jgi:hypothetical protein
MRARHRRALDQRIDIERANPGSEARAKQREPQQLLL